MGIFKAEENTNIKIKAPQKRGIYENAKYFSVSVNSAPPRCQEKHKICY